MSTSFLAMAMAVFAVSAGEQIATDVVKNAYAEYSPAICLVTYTAEVTNPSSGEVAKRDNSSLGLIVTPDGLIMAPGHMRLENSEPFNITVAVGQGDEEVKYGAKLLNKPDEVNVCFLQIDSSGVTFPCARFTLGVDLEVGDPLLLIGILSETMDFARGITTTRVAAVIEKPRKTYPIDGAIRYGFVSGPVVDSKGRLIGVIGFDLTPGEGGDLYVRSGHPLMYQADLFHKYINNPPSESEGGSNDEGAWLGIFTQPLSDDFAEYWGLEKRGGLIISSIVANSPAESAGLEIGDIITGFDGMPIHAKLDREVLGFTKLVRETGVGKEVKMKVLRKREPMEFKVALAMRPTSARNAGEFEDEVLGLTVRELTTDVRILLNLSEDIKGVIVRRVKSGGVADLARMRPGVIIMNLGDHPVSSIQEFEEAVARIKTERPDEVSAFCRLGTATGFCRLEPRWEPDGAE